MLLIFNPQVHAPPTHTYTHTTSFLSSIFLIFLINHLRVSQFLHPYPTKIKKKKINKMQENEWCPDMFCNLSVIDLKTRIQSLILKFDEIFNTEKEALESPTLVDWACESSQSTKKLLILLFLIFLSFFLLSLYLHFLCILLFTLYSFFNLFFLPLILPFLDSVLVLILLLPLYAANQGFRVPLCTNLV